MISTSIGSKSRRSVSIFANHSKKRRGKDEFFPYNIGVMSKVSRGILGEKKVADLINKIKESHYLLNDVTLLNQSSEMSHQIDHILIHPNGLFVIETKNYFGKIIFDEATGEWSKIVRGKTSRISNPLRQNKAHSINLRKAMKSKYKPIPVVVFAQNNAPYLPDENVINLQDLLLFIDSYPYPKRYSQKEMDEMKDLILSASVHISRQEHVENIQTMKKVKKELELEMAYAIERGLCPRCESKIVQKDFEYHCPKCGYRFKL